jgi:hypothetical protein
MVTDFRNQADGSHSDPAQLANGPLPPSVRSPMVRFCTWCKEFCIRPSSVRAEDALILYVYGEERRAFWNSREVIVADGICERCRAEKFPDTLERKTT